MTETLRGHYLIAGKQLRDTNFYKTVVLIIEHSDDGAMGLVVNRPSSIRVSHALSEHFSYPETDEVVFLGGPVEPSALFVLHNAGDLDEKESCVLPDVFVGGSAEAFSRVVQAAAAGTREGLEIRVFSGCAGWGPGQLESELSRGDWYILPADSDSLYDSDPYEIWDEQMSRLTQKNRILPSGPSDPEWN